MKVAHLTSVHSRCDTRIFIKQCQSLVANGYEVTFVVADGLGDETNRGVRILDVGRSVGRIRRIFGATRRVFNTAIRLDADLYHLHDPELIPLGLKLKGLGKKVVFDAHEDVPKQLLGKPYLTPFILRFVSFCFGVFERYACLRLDGIIAATPFIRDKFLAINPCTVDINNFPVVGELDAGQAWGDKAAEVCYVGGLEKNRGISELVGALGIIRSEVRLNLAGRFTEPHFAAEVKLYTGWCRVNELGFLDRLGVRSVLERSIAGVVTLHPIINYLDALPIKMFEYMSAGIPVIASDFPLWSEIVEGNKCGLCVNPLNSQAIADAIDYLVNNPDQAQLMGQNGQRAVLERYNWQAEEIKLLAFYRRILS